jgi:hypothetical protein
MERRRDPFGLRFPRMCLTGDGPAVDKEGVPCRGRFSRLNRESPVAVRALPQTAAQLLRPVRYLACLAPSQGSSFMQWRGGAVVAIGLHWLRFDAVIVADFLRRIRPKQYAECNQHDDQRQIATQ